MKQCLHIFYVCFIHFYLFAQVHPTFSLPSTLLIISPHMSSTLWPVTLRFCSYLLGRETFSLLWQTPDEPHLIFPAITSKAGPWEGNEMREVREWERGGQRTFHPSLCRLPVGPPPPHSQTESVRADVESGAYHTQLGLTAALTVAICGVIISSTIGEKQDPGRKAVERPNNQTSPRICTHTFQTPITVSELRSLTFFVLTSRQQVGEDICELIVTQRDAC